jgi:hypothetical protein
MKGSVAYYSGSYALTVSVLSSGAQVGRQSTEGSWTVHWLVILSKSMPATGAERLHPGSG